MCADWLLRRFLAESNTPERKNAFMHADGIEATLVALDMSTTATGAATAATGEEAAVVAAAVGARQAKLAESASGKLPTTLTCMTCTIYDQSQP